MQVPYASTTILSAAKMITKNMLLKAACLLALLVGFTVQANAQTVGDYRSTVAVFNWTVTGNWERWNGSTWVLNPAEGYPGQSTGTGTVTIRNGATVTINVTPANPIGGLVVGEGTSGVLAFDHINRTLNVQAGGVTVNAGATFRTASPANPDNDTHTLNITGGGSFTNNGTVIFRETSGGNTDLVNINLSGNLAGTGTSTFNNITFNGTNNQTITIGGTISNVQAVTYNNTGLAPNNQITNQSTTFTNALTARQTAASPTNISTFTAGNYRHDNSALYNASASVIAFGSGGTMTVTVLQGTMNFVTTAATGALNLNGGDLIVNGATAVVNIGGTETGDAQRLQTSGATADITVQNGGKLIVGNGNFGDIRFDNNAGTMLVTGSGTLCETGRIVTGSNAGNGGTLSITNGATMRVRKNASADVTSVFFRGTSTINVNSGAQFLVGSPTNSLGNFNCDQNNTFTRALNVDGSTTVMRVYGRILGVAGITSTTYNIQNGAVLTVGENLTNITASSQATNFSAATLNISSGATVRLYENVTDVNNINLCVVGNAGNGGMNINDGTFDLLGNANMTNVLFAGANSAMNIAGTVNVGDGTGADSTARLLIGYFTASELPTPSVRRFLDVEANGLLQVRSDGNVTVGGGNRGRLQIVSTGVVEVLGGKVNIRESLSLGNGSYFGVLGPGTVNIGTNPSSGLNTVTFPVNPTTATRFRVDDNSAVVNIGDGNANLVIGNGGVGTSDDFLGSGFVSFELNRGTLNLNGRFQLSDPNARLVMTGGNFNINPQGDNDVTGTLNTCWLQRGIVIMTGGVLTIVNPPANAGSGVAFLINPQGTPSATSAVLSGDTSSATAIDFSGSTLRFGNGVSSASGAAQEGFEVNLHNSHTYGTIEVNNPTGTNRFVWFYSTPLNTIISLTNLNIIAGEFRQGRPAGPVSPNTLINSASGSFTLEANAYYRIFNNASGNPFPSGFTSYTFTPGSTVEFNANASQTIDARAYSNLILAGNGTYTPNSGTTVSGTLTLQGGTLNAGSNLTMQSGSTLRRSNGHILNVTASGGSGYTAGSIVTFSGGGGSGGIGIVTVGGPSPTIAMINRGSGYTNASAITVSGGGGSGATFTITLGGGAVGTVSDLDGPSNFDYTVEYAGTSQTMANAEFTGAGPRSLRINAITGQTITLNAARTLTRTGSVGGNLELQSGNFSDGGFILDVLGTLSGTADGAHTGSTGRIRLSGTSAQTISGNVTVQNIELNNSSGATLAAGAEMTINGLLTLTNGILDVNTRRLSFGLSAPTPSGTFSSSRMIRTSGTTSALGIRKLYQSGTDFTFPVGVSGTPNVYTPVRINLIAGTGSDFVTLRPIYDEAPTNTGEDALQFYWLVTRGPGLTAVTNVSHEYYYENVSGIVEGDTSLYVPGRNTPSLTNWTIAGTTAEVDEASDPSIIYFNNVSYIDGYFTAGVSNKFDNSTIEVFYSGANGNWGSNSTWRIGSFTGPTPSGIPGGNTPVIIGNGFTVTVPDGAATAVPSVEIQSTGTLRFTGSSMPVTDFGLVSGEGRILIETNITPAQFPNGTYTDFLSTTGGTVEYGGTATYDLPAAPNTYRNLVISGNSTKTFPNQNLTISGNLTVQGGAVAQLSNLVNGNITLNGTASGGGNLTVTGTGSTLRFMNGTARTVTVAGNVTVGSGATFDVATTGTAVANELSIAGNLTNNGTFDMSDGTGASVRRARVTFTGTTNTSISGTGATTDFNVLRVDKGTSQTPILDVTASNFTLSGPTGSTKSLDLQHGTFRLSAGHTITLSTGSPNYVIPEQARLWINHPSAIARIQSGSSDNSLILEGRLQLSDGEVQIGNDNTGTADNSIIYRNNTSVIEVSGGTLTVGAAIRPENSTTPTALNYTQSGGTVMLSNNRANVPSATSPGVSQSNVADLLLRNASSQFNMSGGLLRIDRRNPVGGTTGSGIALRINNASHSVTGGTVQVISSATNVNQPCAIVSSVPFWNLQIGAGTSYTANVGGSQSTPQDFVVRNDFTLNTGGQFRLHRVTGGTANEPRNFTVGGNFTVQNGTFAVGSTSTVTFNGSGLSGQSAPQVITRVGGGTITFRNVTLNNTATPNTVRLGTNTDLDVIGNWTTTAGAFDAQTNTRTVTFNGTVPQTITGTTDFYNLTINNASGVTLTSGTLGIRNTVGSGGTLTLTSGILNIGSNSLVIRNTDNTAIGGTPSASNMIVTNGTASASGVTKHYLASGGNFTFPVGTGTDYTPATLNLTSATGDGTITVAPVNSRHPLATGSTNALLYYWRITNTGLSSPTITHTYQYPASITEEGTPGSYQGGYYVPTSWTTNALFTRTAGPPRTVTFSSINVIQGDFTVGETSAFVTLTVYYSFADGNWNVASSWSTTGFSGPAASSTPGTGNPVIIGNNRTITIPSSGTIQAASTEIQATGTLVIEQTTAPSIGTVSGDGRIRYNVTTTPTLPSLDATFLASGTVEYANAAIYTLPTTPTTYGNLEISAGTKTLGANTTINGNLTISGGTLAMQAFTLNRASSGGTMTMNAGTTLTLTGANNFPANYATYSLATTSTVNYALNGNQTVAAVTYGNLTFSGGGTNNRTLAGATTVQGNLTINAGKTLVTSDNALTVGGNFNLAASTANFTGGTSTVTFNGTGAQTITRTGGGTLTFNNMTVNKSSGSLTLATATAATTLSIPGTLTLTSGAFTIGGSATVPNTLSLAGTVTGSGTITGSTNSNLTITGTGALGTLNFTTGAETLRRLTVNRTGTTPTVTLGTDLSVGGSATADTASFLSGRIITGSNALRLVNQNQVGHGSVNAYVDGILSITYPSGTGINRFFPIGNGAIYRPMRVIGNPVAGTRVEVEMINSTPPGSGESGINNLSGVRYYRITTNNNLASPSVMLSLNTNSPTDEPYTNTSGLRLASTNANPPTSSTTWNVSGASTVSGSFPSVTIQAALNASTSLNNTTAHVTAASVTPDNPLPVNMLSLNAVAKNGRTAMIEWETASEQDNLGFVLLRSETENGLFEEIASYQTTDKLRGQGTKLTETKYLYEDSHNTQPGKTYYYKLVSVDLDGTRHNITLGGQSVWSVELPLEYALDQNYPNPFNPVTTIQFSLEKAGRTTLEIYNVLGQKVATLVNGELSAGAHRYQWNASGMASGIYFYRLRSQNFVATKKMILVK